jgi:uncharacterized repeat protein (TIGR04138 family)
LIDAKLLSKTDSDSRDDFRSLFDLDEVLLHSYQIKHDEVE